MMDAVDGATAYLVAYACIFGTNLMPAFGPPTWALLVFFKFNTDIDMAALVVGGAVASASGRLLLGYGSRALRDRFSEERLASLAAAQEALTRNRRRSIGGLALFLLSPLPSAQLFVAAGLLAVPLVPLAVAFFLGRLVSYTLYLGGATLAADSIGDTFTSSFTSPAGIAAQIVLVLGLVLLVELDWGKILRGRRPTP